MADAKTGVGFVIWMLGRHKGISLALRRAVAFTHPSLCWQYLGTLCFENFLRLARNTYPYQSTKCSLLSYIPFLFLSLPCFSVAWTHWTWKCSFWKEVASALFVCGFVCVCVCVSVSRHFPVKELILLLSNWMCKEQCGIIPWNGWRHYPACVGTTVGTEIFLLMYIWMVFYKCVVCVGERWLPFGSAGFTWKLIPLTRGLTWTQESQYIYIKYHMF